MDKLDKFERILNLVERTRRLDFIAIEAMERMNKQNIDFYNFYNTITKEKIPVVVPEPKLEKESVQEKHPIVTQTQMETPIQKKDNVMEHNDALKEFVKAFNSQLNKIKLETPNSPTPPEENEPQPQPQPQPQPINKDLAMLEKIKGLTGTICDRIKAEADMLKTIQTVMNETHRMSFATWKEMDEYNKGRENTTTAKA